MCGIAGILGTLPEHADDVLRAMTDSIAHRGPDDSGAWLDRDAGIALGHRRLAIVDLSPTGHQPMASPSGRFVLTFNGEIYNHDDLRDELRRAGIRFRGTSDTEVLAAAIETWGWRPTLDRAVGMFALGAWDRELRTLHLARDRFGEKPLYYAPGPKRLVFGSELRVITACPGRYGDIDRDALIAYLRHLAVPAPLTMLGGVRKLRPGHVLEARLVDGRVTTVETPYWSAREVFGRSHARQDDRPVPELLDEVSRLLDRAVRRQLAADVPVGAFLSGGVDSALVVAKLQQASTRPVRTFTVGFAEPEYDESPHARAVAEHLGTDHTEIQLSAADALDLVPRLADVFDEPFADSSQLPTLLVCRETRRHVTVALSGDGGDEVFAGYGRYLRVLRDWQRMSALPAPVRTIGRAAWGSIAAAGSVASRLGLGHPAARVRAAGERRHRHLGARSLADLYLHAVSHWQEPGAAVVNGTEPSTAVNSGGPRGTTLDPLQTLMLADFELYLPDDILVKVDRAAMSVSLETRVPLLDHELVEYVWRLPSAVHWQDGRGKWITRQLLERHVPRALIDRPKRGFAVPLAAWLRGPLRSWADDMLSESRLRDGGYFRVPAVARAWREHRAGHADHSFQLWAIVMFEAWRERQARAPARTADHVRARVAAG
ncbi:MAG: asparagine synthase (glutamine-hydrolyzing) [Steroidobacteraceae bacterium]|nr:asparagine synthase (glutamine-hydrolyzing) [Steroidobacteraceae bacterium]